MVSPPGVGGVAVIQVVGPSVLELVGNFLKNRAGDSVRNLSAHQLKLARWMDGQEHIDDVIVVANNPAAKNLFQNASIRGSARAQARGSLSFGTGSKSQTVCITTHGSVRVVERILMCLERAGVRIEESLPMAAAWEQLSPIESAVMTHLPRTQTKRIAQWLTSQIIHLPAAVRDVIKLLHEGHSVSAMERLRCLESSFDQAQMLLDGAKVVIVGPPNAGKSTLANRLFDRPWSIESEEAGTTRDWVHQPIAIEGIPIILADTAGLREVDNPLEIQALRQAHPIIRSANAQILVLDASRPASKVRQKWLEELLDRRKLLVVLNKSDLGVRREVLLDASKVVAGAPIIVSALRGTGLEGLRRAILSTLFPKGGHLPRSCIWDNDHRRALQQVLQLPGRNPMQAANLLSHTFLGSPGRK